ncbi:hypothetical protein IQ241_24455 [Romeria aff. gracilis LEGE 07310]|uniref:Uncharacterized protein n=1 Tax=Vasconcelosia minhoensis LEGE 07310 TaxID=915328 RepID=A0A8J7AAA2_9CYAN|nr:hypothetical protein [Romeria gracilis]MBE9080402.1 hypothetical protein [Romeria aff. gracilis LEGE 07310]
MQTTIAKPQTNVVEPVYFADKYVKALWLKNADNYYLENRTIVVNLGEEKAYVAVAPEKYLWPRTSTILQEISIKSGDSLLLIEIVESKNIGGVVLDSKWRQLGELMDFPKDVPLWKSPQYDVGIVAFDPYFATGLTDRPHSKRIQKHQVKVNLWFSPAQTDAAIHNKHTARDFLEVHTQLYGSGRMQKFHSNNFDTLYEDVLMNPGNSHLPFASVDESGGFIYPWHQYYADTDCIWMANEFHPID